MTSNKNVNDKRQTLAVLFFIATLRKGLPTRRRLIISLTTNCVGRIREFAD